jgi:hypothetical protein
VASLPPRKHPASRAQLAGCLPFPLFLIFQSVFSCLFLYTYFSSPYFIETKVTECSSAREGCEAALSEEEEKITTAKTDIHKRKWKIPS